MPPKASTAAQSSQIVPAGRREVFSKTNPARQHGKRDEQGQRPTTSKALVLRNGKYGSQGTGELVYMGKMSGREKLDLLAENLIEESKKAILSPLRMEKCVKMAESQTDVYIDDIVTLKDPDSFQHIIEIEIQARKEPNRAEPRRNPSNVAKLVATRIHNSYMLASVWKIVSDSLKQLAKDGLTDQNVKQKLRDVPDLRERYLVLRHIVDVLVKMNQNKFSVLATTTPHYAKYFKLKPSENSDPTKPEYIFDWKDLRMAANSFLDSIIIELCFPQGTYPTTVLYQILRDAVDESPREARRFPQALWDAVGDLSISVELQQLLEAPLLGAEGEAWKQQPRQMPEEYECWLDAQIFSERASDMSGNFKDIIFPLEKTRNKPVLDKMWKQIDQNYVLASGLDIDSLWHLEDAFDYAPQWTAVIPSKSEEDSDDDNYGKRSVVKKKNNKQAKFPAITDGSDGDSDDSMPGLQSVSDSENDDDDDENSDSEFDPYDFGDSSEEESEYDSEEEDEIRDKLRQAMDTAHDSNWLDAEPGVNRDIDPFMAEDKNPFLTLLGSLRGRMFPASPKLKTATRDTREPRATARGAFRATPSGVPKAVPTSKPPPKAETVPTRLSSSATSSAPPAKSQKATVEEVEDEDDIKLSTPKKKKKKSKKKTTSVTQPASSDSIHSMDSMTSKGTTVTPPVPSFMSSMVSLGLGEAGTAQSSHSYLQKENLIKADKKVKSRPDHPTMSSDVGEKGSSSRATEKGEAKAKTPSLFTRLSKKTTGIMKQLLRPKEERKKAQTSLKWENFVKVMLDMGFAYDPSTAGSSVRFDPPNKNDRSISIHKPHPGSTIKPYQLLDISDKLKKYYGWDEEDLMKLDDDRF